MVVGQVAAGEVDIADKGLVLEGLLEIELAFPANNFLLAATCSVIGKFGVKLEWRILILFL